MKLTKKLFLTLLVLFVFTISHCFTAFTFASFEGLGDAFGYYAQADDDDDDDRDDDDDDDDDRDDRDDDDDRDDRDDDDDDDDRYDRDDDDRDDRDDRDDDDRDDRDDDDDADDLLDDLDDFDDLYDLDDDLLDLDDIDDLDDLEDFFKSGKYLEYKIPRFNKDFSGQTEDFEIAGKNYSVHTSFKDAMSVYEGYYDQYIKFIGDMNNGSLNQDEYAKFIVKYEAVSDALDDIDDDKLSKGDNAYFIHVLTRINQKLQDTVKK